MWPKNHRRNPPSGWDVAALAATAGASPAPSGRPHPTPPGYLQWYPPFRRRELSTGSSHDPPHPSRFRKLQHGRSQPATGYTRPPSNPSGAFDSSPYLARCSRSSCALSTDSLTTISRQSTPRFPNSGITSTGMPKQWPSSAMTTRQSLPFREMLPSAVNNVAPSSDTAVPLTTPLLEGPSASLRATPRPSGRTRRPDSNPPDENPPPQGGAQQPPPLLPCEGSPGQNAQAAHTRNKHPGPHSCPKRVLRRRNTPLLPGTHTRRARRRRNAILLHFGRHLGNKKNTTTRKKRKNLKHSQKIDICRDNL
ncbi:hypothetical protein GQR58_001380 [Nymphon striatum]|nr:hypothetical protein GQR58_001380 [Nymphon striatum]